MEEEHATEKGHALGSTSASAELHRWNERFSGGEYLFGTEPNAFLGAQANLLKSGQSALAVADGMRTPST